MARLARSALITGGSAGIGEACVRLLLARGWNVSVLALQDADLKNLEGLDLLVTAGDITSQEVRESALERTLSRYNRIDALINSAGAGLYAPASTVPVAMFARLMDINAVAPLAMAQLAIPVMRQQGGGMIVNIESVAARVALPWATAYSASKFALDSVHDSLRRELRNDVIRLLKVCPGVVDTQFRNRVLGGVPPPHVQRIRRVVSPQLVAARILAGIDRGRNQTLYVPRIGALFTAIGTCAPWLMDFYLSRFTEPDKRSNISRPVRACDRKDFFLGEESREGVGD